MPAEDIYTIPVLGIVLNYIFENSIIVFLILGIFLIMVIAVPKLLYTLKLCGAEAEF